ncbi:hypothetical protein Bhyg_04229 [Pseudolycoriella hygida]|uniref:Uncharacterized protein n=1 Tax=Pseudolycoriella hygida TaxID=35572 RepID=A0A9Q0S887_9DIPT|nr:hypothetical protein Bhyg_04229 [Pseudolycoriella hygida]
MIGKMAHTLLEQIHGESHMSKQRMNIRVNQQMGHEQSSQAEIAGQANTNIIVEPEVNKIDLFHTIILVLLLVVVATQTGYIIYRQHQRRLKKKYLERASKARIPV